MYLLLFLQKFDSKHYPINATLSFRVNDNTKEGLDSPQRKYICDPDVKALLDNLMCTSSVKITLKKFCKKYICKMVPKIWVRYLLEDISCLLNELTKKIP